ncbi:MAG: restriction endonuclease [Candidatus Helarchaeota archaeon]|nr:restriction endonuclease [Candidatus Helarchaeota archaeon]
MSKESKIRDALKILEAIGVPIDNLTSRRKERVALALLAVANLQPDKLWKDSVVWKEPGSWSLTTREIINYWNNYYGENVSSGSYDDVRRKDLIFLVEAGLVIRAAGAPGASTNDPTRRYAIAEGSANVLRLFGTPHWEAAVSDYIERVGLLKDRMERRRQQNKVPVKLPDGQQLDLTSGPHNVLQKAIIENFLPRFVPGSEILYVGDTAKKSLIKDDKRIKELGFFELAHETLPDVVAYDPKKNWIFLIEAVHSSNPISKLRHLNLERLTENCIAPRIYVSVFKDRQSLRNWILDISWETEVWLTDEPDHLIHFDGEKFLGPYK